MEMFDTCGHVTGGLRNSECFPGLKQSVKRIKMGQKCSFISLFDSSELQPSPTTTNIGTDIEHRTLYRMCKFISQVLKKSFIMFSVAEYAKNEQHLLLACLFKAPWFDPFPDSYSKKNYISEKKSSKKDPWKLPIFTNKSLFWANWPDSTCILFCRIW